jgi:hypothetical protein
MSVTSRPNELAGDPAVVGLVGVAAHDHVDRGREALGDRDDRPLQPGAVVDAGAGGLRAALVEQHDDRLDALALQLRRVPVARLDLVAEVQPGHARLRHDVGRALQGHADEADPDARDLLDRIRRQ